MAGNKIFYVTRTEDESTQTAGAATKTRADKPQLLKIVGVDHAGNPDPATPEDNQIYATEEESQEILLTSDTVQDGDYNPVTSDAVFSYIQDQLELSDYETIVLGTSYATAYECQYDGFITFTGNATAPNDIYIYVNNVSLSRVGVSTGSFELSRSILVKKGDKVHSNGTVSAFGTFYKLRDYSRRS